MSKPEFSIKRIREFVDKDYQSVAARMAKSMLQHYDESQRYINEALNMGDGTYRP